MLTMFNKKNRRARVDDLELVLPPTPKAVKKSPRKSKFVSTLTDQRLIIKPVETPKIGQNKMITSRKSTIRRTSTFIPLDTIQKAVAENRSPSKRSIIIKESVRSKESGKLSERQALSPGIHLSIIGETGGREYTKEVAPHMQKAFMKALKRHSVYIHPPKLANSGSDLSISPERNNLLNPISRTLDPNKGASSVNIKDDKGNKKHFFRRNSYANFNSSSSPKLEFLLSMKPKPDDDFDRISEESPTLKKKVRVEHVVKESLEKGDSPISDIKKPVFSKPLILRTDTPREVLKINSERNSDKIEILKKSLIMKDKSSIQRLGKNGVENRPFKLNLKPSIRKKKSTPKSSLYLLENKTNIPRENKRMVKPNNSGGKRIVEFSPKEIVFSLEEATAKNSLPQDSPRNRQSVKSRMQLKKSLTEQKITLNNTILSRDLNITNQTQNENQIQLFMEELEDLIHSGEKYRGSEPIIPVVIGKKKRIVTSKSRIAITTLNQRSNPQFPRSKEGLVVGFRNAPKTSSMSYFKNVNRFSTPKIKIKTTSKSAVKLPITHYRAHYTQKVDLDGLNYDMENIIRGTNILNKTNKLKLVEEYTQEAANKIVLQKYKCLDQIVKKVGKRSPVKNY